jgi:hypothetical protein
MDGGIVRGIQLLTLEVVAQDGPHAVILAAAHAARIVFHGNQPALVVARVPIGVPGLGLEDAHMAVVLAPAQHAVIWNVATQKAAPVSHPHRAF